MSVIGRLGKEMFGTCLLTVAYSPPSLCSFTDPAISMDLLRAVLQPSINEEIQTVFNKYMKVRRMQRQKKKIGVKTHG